MIILRRKYNPQDTIYPWKGTVVYSYNEQTINLIITSDFIGNYRIGILDENDTFKVAYIGRATEQSVKERLLQHIHNRDFNNCTVFDFNVAETPEDAYYRECLDYHAFDDGQGGDGFFKNQIHPSKINADLECPWPECQR